MQVRSVLLILALLFAGCASDRGAEGPPGVSTPTPEPINETLYLKSLYGLSSEAPTKSNADRVAATPFVNGFANEDIKAFVGAPIPTQRNVSMVRLHAYYEVAGPTVDPFPVQGNPQDSRQIVFWLGTNRTYPMSVSTIGPTVLVPGRVYEAKAEFGMPPGGWILPKDEKIQLLIATLAFNAQGYELRFLVDSTATPSRLEVVGQTSHLPLPATLTGVTQSFTIPGNGGMFTGATPDQVPSRIRTPVQVPAPTTYFELRVVFRGNAGGKSDLDFVLFAPDGMRTLVSSTPFQDETIRAFGPQLAVLGPGTYSAEIEAYSGVNTRFELQSYFAPPR